MKQASSFEGEVVYLWSRIKNMATMRNFCEMPCLIFNEKLLSHNSLTSLERPVLSSVITRVCKQARLSCQCVCVCVCVCVCQKKL